MSMPIKDIAGEIHHNSTMKPKQESKTIISYLFLKPKEYDLLMSGEDNKISKLLRPILVDKCIISNDEKLFVSSLDEDGMYYTFKIPDSYYDKKFALVLNNRANMRDVLKVYRFNGENIKFNPNTIGYDEDGNKYYLIVIKTGDYYSENIDEFDFNYNLYANVKYYLFKDY